MRRASLLHREQFRALHSREDIEDFRSRPIGSTTFIQADPPAARGEPRFEARFSIDREKRLCVTVRDLLSGKTLMREAPLVKLR